MLGYAPTSLHPTYTFDKRMIPTYTRFIGGVRKRGAFNPTKTQMSGPKNEKNLPAQILEIDALDQTGFFNNSIQEFRGWSALEIVPAGQKLQEEW